MIVNGQPYGFYMYDQILKEQLLIAYLSNGAITVTETDNMPIHDRKTLLATLQQAEEAKKKRLKEIEEEHRVRAGKVRSKGRGKGKRKR